jgi:hypothetical protein
MIDMILESWGRSRGGITGKILPGNFILLGVSESRIPIR